MYLWRKMTPAQREAAMEYRRTQRFPKHSLPHFDVDGSASFLITSSCYEHRHIPGSSPTRMSECEAGMLAACGKYSESIFAWCVLPNHYHVHLRTKQIRAVRKELGLFHSGTSFKWNREDNTRGRQVWHNCFEREIASPRHSFATLNYVLNNAVHHGYAKRWQDWAWSNAREYLEAVGREEALEIWNKYPVLDYGRKWDIY